VKGTRREGVVPERLREVIATNNFHDQEVRVMMEEQKVEGTGAEERSNPKRREVAEVERKPEREEVTVMGKEAVGKEAVVGKGGLAKGGRRKRVGGPAFRQKEIRSRASCGHRWRLYVVLISPVTEGLCLEQIDPLP